MDMSNESQSLPASGWLDTLIKVLTVLKLLVQLSFYGLMLGGALWILLANPLPKLMEDLQAKMLSSFMQQSGR